MKISPEALAIARNIAPGGSSTGILAAELIRLDREATNAAIRERVVVLNLRHMKALKDYQKEKEAIDADVRQLRADCPHHETTCHGDPSGGSDSHTICEVCDATWK